MVQKKKKLKKKEEGESNQTFCLSNFLQLVFIHLVDCTLATSVRHLTVPCKPQEVPDVAVTIIECLFHLSVRRQSDNVNDCLSRGTTVPQPPGT